MSPKDELMEENALLLTLESTAAQHGGPLSRGWVRYLRKWRDVNDDLVALADADLKRALDEEIQLLKAMQTAILPLVEKMRDSNTGDLSPSGRFWRDMLEVEVRETERLKNSL
jgi:hypothetical protein